MLIALCLMLGGCAGYDDAARRKPKRQKFFGKFWGEDDEEDEEDEQGEYEDSHLKLSLIDSGYDVFSPAEGVSFDYRYGPSVLLNDDGSMEAYFSSPGDSSEELDWITYRHSDDGGKTWSDEKAVLSPTPQSKDYLSVCDPDVFYHKGYYYIGYTSTIDSTKQGIVNSVFLARSRKPDGPFEKWNGKDWGGDPEPIIYYDGTWNGWGAGEPSFVLLDDTIYVYSTLDAYTADNDAIKVTRVHTADITEYDWPAKLTLRGYAVVRTDTPVSDEESGEKYVRVKEGQTYKEEYVYSGSDSWDVAYVEEYDKFIAVCTNRRLTDDSCLLYYESNDGVYFERVSEINNNVYCGCHNAGIMTDGTGHINEGDDILIGYAYSGANNSEWGTWATRFVNAKLEIADTVDRSEEKLENLREPIEYSAIADEVWPIMIGSDSTVKTTYSDAASFNISYIWTDSYKGTHYADVSDIKFSDYDKDVIDIDDGVIIPESAGTTTVRIDYGGVSRLIRLNVLHSGESYGSLSSDEASPDSLLSFFSPTDGYIAPISSPYAQAIRPLIKYKDYILYEPSLDGMVKHGITFESENKAICDVRADGMIMPLSPGETMVKVSCSEGLSYRVKVEVAE